METIYNTKSRLRRHYLEWRIIMQQLTKVLMEKHYFFFGIGLMKQPIGFKHVLGASRYRFVSKVFSFRGDCWLHYKTNRYKMLLFAMVKMTLTKMTLSIPHCFMHKELEDNYQWCFLVWSYYLNRMIYQQSLSRIRSLSLLMPSSLFFLKLIICCVRSIFQKTCNKIV